MHGAYSARGETAQNRSRSPTGTTAGPSAKRTCAPRAGRRAQSGAVPKRRPSGPRGRHRVRCGRGRGPAGGSAKSRSGSSKTSAGGSLTIATSRPSSASSRPTTGPAIDRRRAPSRTRTANGGRRWSAAFWRPRRRSSRAAPCSEAPRRRSRARPSPGRGSGSPRRPARRRRGSSRRGPRRGRPGAARRSAPRPA